MQWHSHCNTWQFRNGLICFHSPQMGQTFILKDAYIQCNISQHRKRDLHAYPLPYKLHHTTFMHDSHPITSMHNLHLVINTGKWTTTSWTAAGHQNTVNTMVSSGMPRTAHTYCRLTILFCEYCTISGSSLTGLLPKPFCGLRLERPKTRPTSHEHAHRRNILNNHMTSKKAKNLTDWVGV